MAQGALDVSLTQFASEGMTGRQLHQAWQDWLDKHREASSRGTLRSWYLQRATELPLIYVPAPIENATP